ncbi:ABC transporter substrate-binding protein [Synechococcus sp. BA-132 BA5]|uniref:ABC transporter substrate-binding protein n=1 Tax=Synechococcus sp. BA-132 BA5 TaxID=3110252 RepID=UPI002B2145A4|nr:ABC transporter substrate-binding protein [Synechococcus sp. BA-132 BA5]MEA5416719.1 ABC transporter substrate-binding protein [Synechococcus sp. BA-132 BA5]
MGLQRREFLSLVGLGALGTVVLSACGKPGGGARVKGPTIGVLQMVDAPPPNNTRKGFEAALAAAGYIPGQSVNFIQKDAAGELANTTLVMKQFVGDGVDMILAVGTPPLQAAMKVAPQTTPVIFCYCSNPWGAGAGTPPGAVGQHRPNVVGTIGTNPVDKELDLARQIDPDLKTVGLIYNPGEPNSEYEAKVLKREAAKRDITVVEQSVANSGEVLQAAQVLAQKKVDAFVKIGDYATIQGFGSIAKVGLEKKIPVYSVDADDIKMPGCLATVGWSYFDDGYAAGKLAVRVLKGESPATMAFEPLTKTEMLLNRATAAAIGVTLPEDLLKQAKEVVG